MDCLLEEEKLNQNDPSKQPYEFKVTP